jgi:MFS family permease
VLCIGVIALFAAFSLAVMLLWNALLPNLLGTADINYFQAAGILALCRILFGGLGSGGFRPGMRGHLRDMSRDEREELMRRAQDRFARRRDGHSGCSGSGRHGRAPGEPGNGHVSDGDDR